MTPPVASLFGKLPTRGDFIRVNAASPEALDWASWLEAGVDAARAAGCGLPGEPVCFFYRRDGANKAMLGVFHSSTDKVGRVFPVSVFCAVDLKASASSFAGMPAVAQAFVEQALAMTREAPALAPEALEARVRSLPVPTITDLDRGKSMAAELLARTTNQEHTIPLLGPTAAGGQYYAFYTLAMACRQARAPGGNKTTITIDCPGETSAHQLAWLEMTRRLLDGSAVAPAIFWTVAHPSPSFGSVKVKVPTPPVRLLVSPGEASAHTLTYLAKPGHQSSKLWPLVVNKETAIEAARKALSESQRAAIDRADGSLEQLIGALARQEV